MTTCSRCDSTLDPEVPGWCPSCGTAHRIAARVLAQWLLPAHEDVSLPNEGPDPLGWPDYDALRESARDAAGVDESVVVVHGRLRDSEVEVIAVVWDFSFLGGSMGTDAGRRIADAYDRARDLELPIVLLPSTGGARMQEGMASLVQMAATTVAATSHAEAGLLQVAVLRDPTTGGVFASHANLADVVLAEPGATIGFAGPRVAAAMTGGPLPEGSHTPRGALASGLVDQVVKRPDLPQVLAQWCGWLRPMAGTVDAKGLTQDDRSTPHPSPAPDAWQEVLAARAPDRPRAPAFLDLLEVAGELHGDRSGGDDPSIRTVCARVDGRPVVVVAMDRSRGGHIGPSGYRKAWRAIGLAERLQVPLVTLIDTPGADAGAASEAGGIAHHIGRTFQRVLTAGTPVVSLVIGEGGSGGALALAVGDRLLIQEHAIFSVIGPEGAAAILYRDAERAAEVSELLDPTARRLEQLGIADAVVPEDDDPVERAWHEVARHLDELADLDPADLRRSRADRWRRGWGAGRPAST